MISLILVPVFFPDPDSRKVLLPDPGATSREWRGAEGEGWYSVKAAIACLVCDGYQVRPTFDRCMAVAEGETLVAIVQPQGRTDDEKLTAVFVGHFSAPTDADDHFEDAPIPFNFDSSEVLGEGGAELLPSSYAGVVYNVPLDLPADPSERSPQVIEGNHPRSKKDVLR